MSVSKKIKQQMSEGSWVRRMFEEGLALKKKYGSKNVFDLSLGNPIMEPPVEFRQELLRLAQGNFSGLHRYMPNAGYDETRAAVASGIARETGLPFSAEDVVMTCGAGGALNVVLKAILDASQEVILFAPYFVEYVYYVDNYGGVCKIIDTDENFRPDLNKVEAAINSNTRAVLINSPNNPTGVVYEESLIADLGRLLKEKEEEYGTEIYLISDEPYKKLLYDGTKYPYVYTHYSRSTVATSHSKDLALPGERIGFIAVNPSLSGKRELVDALTFSNRILGFVNAPALMQHIVARLQNVTVNIEEYRQKRDLLFNQLSEMGYSMVKPQGAFYMFPKSLSPDDVAFVRQLQEQRVLVVPGRGFGTPGHFRISYCVDDTTLEGAMKGFKVVAAKFGLPK